MKNKFYVIILIVLAVIVSAKSFAQKPVSIPIDTTSDGGGEEEKKEKPIFEEPHLNLAKILKKAEEAGQITPEQISDVEKTVQGIKKKKRHVWRSEIVQMAQLSRINGIEQETAINFANKVFDLFTIYIAQGGYRIQDFEWIVGSFPIGFVYKTATEKSQRISFSREGAVQITSLELAKVISKGYTIGINEINKEIKELWIPHKSSDQRATEIFIEDRENQKRFERMEGKGKDHDHHGSR